MKMKSLAKRNIYSKTYCALSLHFFNFPELPTLRNSHAGEMRIANLVFDNYSISIQKKQSNTGH